MREKIIDAILVGLVFVYTVVSGNLSLDVIKRNAWAVLTPWIWLMCGIAAFHILRSAVVLTREIAAESSLIEIPGKRRTDYSPAPPHYRSKVWAGSLALTCLLGLISYFVYASRSPALVNTNGSQRTVAAAPAATPTPPPTSSSGPVPMSGRGESVHKRPESLQQPSSANAKHVPTLQPPQPSTATLEKPPVSAPSQSTPPLTGLQVPRSLIPQDPVQAYQASEGMRLGLVHALEGMDTITFLVSHATEEGRLFIPSFESLLSSACKATPRQCWFIGPETGRNLDRPPVQGSTISGLTIHGVDVIPLADALRIWFEVHSTSKIPESLSGYRSPDTKHLIWIEIGPGSPWKEPTAP